MLVRFASLQNMMWSFVALVNPLEKKLGMSVSAFAVKARHGTSNHQRRLSHEPPCPVVVRALGLTGLASLRPQGSQSAWLLLQCFSQQDRVVRAWSHGAGMVVGAPSKKKTDPSLPSKAPAPGSLGNPGACSNRGQSTPGW